MLPSSKVPRTFEFLFVFGADEKSQEANCTGFSVEFFGSQSVENKNLNIDNFFRELEKNPPTAFKSLGIYL